MERPLSNLFYGGSFNPVHAGHMACSHAAALAGGFERVVLVPSHQPVLKEAAYDLAPAEDRLAMLMLAARAAPPGVAYSVDALELERIGPSYTFDTVNTLRQRGLQTVDWLIGADQLLNLHRWHRFDELLDHARFWVMARPGYAINWDVLDERVRALRKNVLEIPPMDISSTLIRRRVQAGESINGLVPDAVREYIVRRNLYSYRQDRRTLSEKP